MNTESANEKNEKIGEMDDGKKDVAKDIHENHFEMERPIEYSGLKKEELMQYLKDPYWVWLRIILLTIFLLTWLAMLIVAIVVIVLTPKCPARPEQHWFQKGMVYCVHTKTFLDSNQDGVGDLNGIKDKLDYIKDQVKADAISLSSLQIEGNMSVIYSTTNANFTSITPEFGSMKDFQNLVKAVHRKGMKLILEIDPFTTTTMHPWFQMSKDNVLPYRDYYIWSYDVHLKNSYLHPILNLINPAVVKEISEAIKFWLGLKVDGVNIMGNRYALNYYLGGQANLLGATYEEFVSSLLANWTGAVKEYIDTTPQLIQFSSKVLMSDIQEPTNQTSDQSLYQPINNHLLKIDSNCKTDCIRSLISDWLKALGSRSPLSNWRVSSAQSSRIASKQPASMLNAISLLLLTLPGSPHVLYGDEIGMKDAVINDDYSIVNFATNIMQWNDEANRGFSQISPLNHYELVEQVKDVQAQLAIGSGMSHLKVFTMVASQRNIPSLAWGDMHLAQSRDILFYVRKAEGHPCIVVAVNLGDQFATVSLKKGEMANMIHSELAEVLTSTYNFDNQQSYHFKDGAQLNLHQAILLHPGQGIMLKCILEKSWFS